MRRRRPRPEERTAYSGSSPENRSTISRTEAPRGTTPNTAEPLPVKCGSSRPAARSLAHSDSRSRRRCPKSCSNRLPRRMSESASTRCRPTVAANLRWCTQGVKEFLARSCRRNACAVETRHAGIAITALNGERSRSRVSRSPRPRPSAVPPVAANGTSDPSCNAKASRSARVSLRRCSASSAAIAAAASALPPPRPACAGMRLVSVKRAPPGSDNSRASNFAARNTRLPAPAGTRSPGARRSRPRTAADS